MSVAYVHTFYKIVSDCNMWPVAHYLRVCTVEWTSAKSKAGAPSGISGHKVPIRSAGSAPNVGTARLAALAAT